MAFFEQLPTIAFYDSRKKSTNSLTTGVVPTRHTESRELAINVPTQNPVSYRIFNRTSKLHVMKHGEPLLLFAYHPGADIYSKKNHYWLYWPLLPMLQGIIPKNALRWKSSPDFAPSISLKLLMDENGVNYEDINTQQLGTDARETAPSIITQL